MIKQDENIGKIVHNCEIVARVKDPTTAFAVYKFKCLECGHEFEAKLFFFKRTKGCKNCKRLKREIKKENELEALKILVKDFYEILGYADTHYQYVNCKCIHCGKLRRLNVFLIKNGTWSKCKCRPKVRVAKHDKEVINGYLLEATGKTAYKSSRSLQYKYTCIHCGKVHYDQYSTVYLNTPCNCQKIKLQIRKGRKKNERVVIRRPKVSHYFTLNGKTYTNIKSICDDFHIGRIIVEKHINSNDLYGLKLYAIYKDHISKLKQKGLFK